MAALSNYLENKLVDQIFRAQAYAFPTTLYVALYTALPTPVTGSGTEVTGGSYARVALADALTAWAGTQAAASVVASTGTSGATSNNAAITFPAPTAAWGSIVGFAIYDAATVGNELFWGALGVSKTVNSGDAAPSFAAGSLAITFS